jgi:hypothetical protein
MLLRFRRVRVLAMLVGWARTARYTVQYVHTETDFRQPAGAVSPLIAVNPFRLRMSVKIVRCVIDECRDYLLHCGQDNLFEPWSQSNCAKRPYRILKIVQRHAERVRAVTDSVKARRPHRRQLRHAKVYKCTKCRRSAGWGCTRPRKRTRTRCITFRTRSMRCCQAASSQP